MGMLVILSLPVFAAWSVFDETAPPPVRTMRLVTTLITMMIMGGVVFLRQHLLDRELLACYAPLSIPLRISNTCRRNWCNRKNWRPSGSW